MIRRFLLAMVALFVGATVQARERVNFDKGWRFILADSAQMAKADYNDAGWRLLDVPHDWAIEGDFYVGNPSGAGGGALPGGVGWYRKKFTVDGLQFTGRMERASSKSLASLGSMVQVKTSRMSSRRAIS